MNYEKVVYNRIESTRWSFRNTSYNREEHLHLITPDFGGDELSAEQ